MSATPARFAYRCLPLLIANQAGWLVLSGHALTVTWNGGADVADLRIDYRTGAPPYPAQSHFGHGILTWTLPYLFRTPPGYNLLVRGPANWPKDGAYPLEGVVETDWAVATFTMNWQITRPNVPIRFDQDEPICMLVPQRRGELEAFRPEVRSIETEPGVAREYGTWSARRERFLIDLREPRSAAAQRGWQKDYFQGVSPGGLVAPEHQLKLRLREFAAPAAAPGPSARRRRIQSLRRSFGRARRSPR